MQVPDYSSMIFFLTALKTETIFRSVTLRKVYSGAKLVKSKECMNNLEARQVFSL